MKNPATRRRFIRALLIGSVAALSLSSTTASGALIFTDNFDDNTINNSIWTATTYGGNTIEAVNQRIEMTQNGGGAAVLAFNPSLVGDFTARVDYQLLNWPASNKERVGLGQGTSSVIRISDNNWGGESYLTDFGDGPQVWGATTDMTGTLRYDRVGSTIHGYFWDGLDWILIHSRSGTSTADATVMFRIWPSGYGTDGVKVAFDNFYLESADTPALENGSVPLPTVPALLLIGMVALAGRDQRWRASLAALKAGRRG